MRLQVMVLDTNVFAEVCAAMFCWSGLMGLLGGLRTLLSHCVAARFEPVQAVRSYHLKVRGAGALRLSSWFLGWCSAAATTLLRTTVERPRQRSGH